MASSLNVSQDDMIDILIGHANVSSPLTVDQNTSAQNQGKPYQESYTELLQSSDQSLPPSDPSLPTSVQSLPQHNPSLPTSVQSLPQSNPSLPTSVQSLPQSNPSLPTRVQSLPQHNPSLPQANPSPPQSQLHNQYLCPGCQKAILYTNRSSLVSLLSLHKLMCHSSHEYRYMCLECHDAFKTIVQLQGHEGMCKSKLEDTKTSVLNPVLPDRTSNATDGVNQSLQPVSGQHSDIQNIDRNSETVDTFVGLMGQGSSSCGHDKFNRGGKFNQTAGANSSGRKAEQSGVIQYRSDNRQSYGLTPGDNHGNDYKIPMSFYHPDGKHKDAVNESVDTGSATQGKPEQHSNQLIQGGFNTGGSGGIDANGDGNVMEKEDSVVHSMSEQSYEQLHHLGKDTGQDCSQDGGLTAEGDHNPATVDKNIVDQKIFVRESWSQTFEQPEEEVVEVLLDEISPAGRRRRTCTRRMTVYNEKELRAEREQAEIEMMRLNARRKRIRISRTEAVATEKTPKKGKKILKKDQTVKIPKPPKEIKEKKVRQAKVKEQELAVPMQCQQCPETFNRYSMYTKHFQRFHEKAMCQYCGKQCIRRKLKSHESCHRRTFKCPYPGCTKMLNSNNRLKRHTRIHTGEKPFTCDICNKPFAGKENMVKHKKRVHEGEKPYQCRYCGRKFADTGRLKYHEGTHTRPRPTDYQCKFCGRGYKSHVGCYLHERTHTGKTVKCQYCGKAFMAKEHLKRHEYIHTGNYPFRCGNCQKGFKDNSSMKRHKCLAVL